MYAASVDCFLATLRGQNSAAKFAANEGRDSKTQVKLEHGTLWQGPREATVSGGRRHHPYHDVSARVRMCGTIVIYFT